MTRSQRHSECGDRPVPTPDGGSHTGQRLLGYCRVSTNGQDEHGVSLEEQRHRIVQYADAHGDTLVCVVHDAVASGMCLARPAFQWALRRMRKG